MLSHLWDSFLTIFYVLYSLRQCTQYTNSEEAKSPIVNSPKFSPKLQIHLNVNSQKFEFIKIEYITCCKIWQIKYNEIKCPFNHTRPKKPSKLIIGNKTGLQSVQDLWNKFLFFSKSLIFLLLSNLLRRHLFQPPSMVYIS